MAFPVVEARATGRTTAANVTSHPITLPSGITAGDLLLVVFSCDGNPTITVDTGASGTGWNALTQGANTTVVSSNVFWKIAEGSDALTLTTSAGEQSSHASLRISGGYSVTGTSANGSSTNSNPPNHAGHDGTQDYLWIATRAGDSTVVATVAPTNFTNLQTLAAAGTAGASVNTAERSVNSASQDPGTFTSASEQWVSFTVAVSPVIPTQTLTPTAFSDSDSFGAADVALSGGGGPGPLTFGSYLWADAFSTDSATFANMAIGAADADRWVIAAVLVNHNTSREVGTVTIGGVSATQLYEAPTLSASGITMSWWKANVPTGTTANVVVTTSAGIWYDGACATYTCAGEPFFHDGAHDATYTGTTFEVAVNVPEGGAVLALVRNDGAGSLSGWTGITADETDETYRVYVASDDQLSAQSGRAVAWTGTAQSSVTGFYGLAVVAVEVEPLPGGGTQTLVPALFSDGDSFYAATVGSGAVTLSPSLLADGETFPSATVARGAVSLSPTLVSDGDTFWSATIARGPVSLAPAIYTDADSFGAATVSQDGGPQTLTPALFSDGDAFGAAVVSPGPVSLAPALYADGDQFGAAVVTPGAVAISPGLLADGDTFGVPTIVPGAVTLGASLYADGESFGAAIVSLGGAGRTLAPDLVLNASTFGAAIVSPGALTLTPTAFSDPDSFGAAEVLRGAVAVAPALLGNVTTFGAAIIVPGAVTLSAAIYADPDTFGAAVVGAGHLPGRAAFPSDSRTGGALAASERGGRVLNSQNGGTLGRG